MDSGIFGYKEHLFRKVHNQPIFWDLKSIDFLANKIEAYESSYKTLCNEKTTTKKNNFKVVLFMHFVFLLMMQNYLATNHETCVESKKKSSKRVVLNAHFMTIILP